MNLIESFLYLIVLVLVLSSIKVSIFFVIIGGAIYLYIILQLFLLDPLNHSLSIVTTILSNPIGLLPLLIPLLIHWVVKFFKKKHYSKKN